MPIYESFTQTLLSLNGLPTLQQRVGNRNWASASTQDGTGIWGRMEASRQRPNAAFSTSAADRSINGLQFQMGADATLDEREDGATLIGGITAHYGEADTTIRSMFGNGTIDAQGYGLGATLTWYGPEGFYVDGQTQVSWFKADLKSVALGSLASSVNGKGEAVSLEVGKRSPIGGKLTLTPQIQMARLGTHLVHSVTGPLGDNGDESDCSEVVLGMSVISCGNASPVFEAPEESFYDISATIDAPIKRIGRTTRGG